MTAIGRERLSDSLLETAGSWHDRLQREKVPAETRREFEAWLGASPAHIEAYTKVEHAWRALKERAEAPAILALRHEAALRLTRRVSARLIPRAAVAILAVLVVGAGLFAWLTPNAVPQALVSWVRGVLPDENRYATATGERLTATLHDGSQVTLDTESELEVAFSKAARLVYLKRGQVCFEVAKDKNRPFVVQAGNRRLIAVGTAFDVRLNGAQIRVTMVEGTVRVERGDTRGESTPPPQGKPRASGPAASSDIQTITAGEQLWEDREDRDHVATADAERATSWRRGQLIFDNVPLGEAVAEINRYSDTKIRLRDSGLADVRISGSFATGRTHVFVEAVTSYFPIDVAESNEHVVVLKARQ